MTPMPRSTDITYAGRSWTVDAACGESVMAAAVAQGVPGIDADCGGGRSCGTCHVIVDEAWFDRTGAIAAMEQGVLEFVPERTPTSRLSCQIAIFDALDGLVVRLPEFQM